MLRIMASCCLLVVVGCLNSGCQRFGWPAWRQSFAASLRYSQAEEATVLQQVNYLQSLGRVDLALQELLPAIRREPQNLKLLNALGVCYDLLGDHLRAQQIFRQVLAAEPQNLGVRNNLGYSYLLAGDYQQAIAELEQVLAQDPNNPRARNNLGLAWLKEGRAEKALKLWEETWGRQKAREQLKQMATLFRLPLPEGLQSQEAKSQVVLSDFGAMPEKDTNLARKRGLKAESLNLAGARAKAQLRHNLPLAQQLLSLNLVRKIGDSRRLEEHWERAWEAKEPRKTIIF